MSSGAAGPREGANGASESSASAKASSASVQNGASKPLDVHLGAKRSVFIYQVLVGYDVQVQVTGGLTYEGVFSGITSEKLVLKMAKLVRDPSGPVRPGKPEPSKIFKDSEWTRIDAADVRMGAADVGPFRIQDDAGGFGTDSAISRGRGGTDGRQLERWAPDAAEAASFQHLEESTGREHLGWDQFALNERQFGVKTDYKEEFYTTALDPSKSKISMAEANRIASEIERGNKGITNLHMLEERGIEIDDGDMDEEDRYGAVIREDQASGAGRRAAAAAAPPSNNNGRPAGAWGRGPPTTSQPISIDPRKEANKVRAQMTGGNKAASPYGTPKLASPLVNDAQKLAALNLDPGVPHVDEATRREFEAFKAEQAKGAKASSLSEMKQFSQEMGSKLNKASSPETGEGEEKKKTLGSGLNPNAKSFSFNINAKTFAPTSLSPAAAGAARPAGVPSTGGVGPSRPPPMDAGVGPRRHDMYQQHGDDRRGDRRGNPGRPPPPPPEGGHPPPPPPGRSPPGGGPGHMQMQNMMTMPPMMMMQNGAQPQWVMVQGPRPGGPMFMQQGTPPYMPGRPMMMVGPGNMPMHMPHGMPGMNYPGGGGGGYPGGSPGRGHPQQHQHRGGGGGDNDQGAG